MFISPKSPNIFVFINAVIKYIDIIMFKIFENKYVNDNSIKCFDFIFFFINNSVINGSIVRNINQNRLV